MILDTLKLKSPLRSARLHVREYHVTRKSAAEYHRCEIYVLPSFESAPASTNSSAITRMEAESHWFSSAFKVRCPLKDGNVSLSSRTWDRVKGSLFFSLFLPVPLTLFSFPFSRHPLIIPAMVNDQNSTYFNTF